MQHYFVEEIKNSLVYFKKEDYHHIKNVMRFNSGDNVVAIYENNQYLVELNIADNIIGKIISKLENKNNKNVNLIMSLIKGDKFELCIQKSAELNVTNFIPFKAERSIINISDNEKKNIRWNKIIKESSEQCERDQIMNLSNIISKESINNYLSDINIMLDENEGRNNPQNTILNYLYDKDYNSITLIIGPEGGFTENERKYLKNLGFISLSLSNSILRAETAVISSLSIINAINQRK